MKQVTTATTNAWLSGDYTGDQRPMVRATIGQWYMERHPYKLRWADSTTWRHNGHFANGLFNQDGHVRELLNIKSIKYSRGVDTDVASATIVLYNVQWAGDAGNPREEEFDFPGWYTPNRGEIGDWNYASNYWKRWLIPDRMIRTYEGYGVDRSVIPEDDPHMYPSGVWLIDRVKFGTDGLITIECRDLARLLLQQILYPPIVPFDVYPLSFEKFKDYPQPEHLAPSGVWVSPTYDSNSNDNVLSAGLMDGGVAAVAADGSVHGHYPAGAFDPDTNFWLSAGSADPNQLEWIQGTVPDKNVAAIKINVKGGPYKVYVSIYNKTKGWRGAATIPYEIADDGTDVHADIPYVATYWMDPGDVQTFELPRVFQHVTKIRFTFASRWNSGIGHVRPYKTALQDFQYGEDLVKTPGSGTLVKGNYGDFTDIIKWLCAWSGFWWPDNAKIRRSDNVLHAISPVTTETALPKGHVWGDFEKTRTTGIVKLDVDMFDQKPVMDGIAGIRDIVGFDFWVDESGGVIWRMPNVWKKGNYLMPNGGGDDRPRTTNIVTVDERTTLIELEVVLDSDNIRERIVVADVNGDFGVSVRGFNPSPTGQRRVGGWLDQHFRDRKEARRVADLIAVRQAFTYRQNTLTIAANPAIQVDDQIVIKERMTGEGYLHRVVNIESDFDFESGKWTYALTTQWLGPEAFTDNAWRAKLSQLTDDYLREMGH